MRRRGLRRLHPQIAPAVLLTLLGAVNLMGACSSDDPIPGPVSSAGKATGDGGQAQAGATAAPNAGDDTGGTAPRGGAPTTEGGSGHQSGGSAGHSGEPNGGVQSDGGATLLPVGGDGAGGSGGVDSAPPDLVTATGGPWPDSATGACSNPSKATACPQSGAPFFGQDGTYRLNVPSYTPTLNTLKDSVTSLVWQLTPDTALKTQAEATAYCDALQLGGQSDWRLPTRLEYVSVLDEGMGSGYAMPAAVSIDTVGAQWTASATGTAANQFFIVNDQFGTWTVGGETTKLAARCVRGPVVGGSLQVETDVVTDTATKLVWQLTALDVTARNWQEALDYCETLAHAGKEDWRLPNIKELATIVDEAALAAPAIRAEYGASAPEQYWSSTPAPTFGSEGFAFALETGVGYSTSLKMAETAAAARCVRSQD